MRSNRSLQGRLRAVADLLRRDWDPIGGVPADEYDAYAPIVASLVSEGATPLMLAKRLSEIEHSQMGLVARPADDLLPVAARAIETLQGEALAGLLLAEDHPHEDLESFIGDELFRGGVWSSPREMDGVRDIRVLTDGPRRAAVAGEVWTIDQKTHLFGVELIRGDKGTVRWTLWFGLSDAPTGTTLYLLDADGIADEPWEHQVAGTMPPSTANSGANRPG